MDNGMLYGELPLGGFFCLGWFVFFIIENASDVFVQCIAKIVGYAKHHVFLRQKPIALRFDNIRWP